jgi:hypothetical protein
MVCQSIQKIYNYYADMNILLGKHLVELNNGYHF